MVKKFNKFLINSICKDLNIRNYTINNDMTVDVDGDVEILNKKFKKIPFKFNEINGNFYIHNNSNLISLKNSPKKIVGNFNCMFNKLNSLKHSPDYVENNFICKFNHLESLEYLPNYIGGTVDATHNNINTLKGLKNHNIVINLTENNIRSIKHSGECKLILNRNPFFEIETLSSKTFTHNTEYINYFNELDIINENETSIILDRLNYFLQDIGGNEINSNQIRNYKIIK